MDARSSWIKRYLFRSWIQLSFHSLWIEITSFKSCLHQDSSLIKSFIEGNGRFRKLKKEILFDSIFGWQDLHYKSIIYMGYKRLLCIIKEITAERAVNDQIKLRIVSITPSSSFRMVKRNSKLASRLLRERWWILGLNHIVETKKTRLS